MEEKSAIANFYADQSVLITGASGFMGKILVEKLLRSCPRVSKIFLLVRPKKGKKPVDRLEDIINSPVFDSIRDQPNGEALLEKLVCVGGDIVYHNLDLFSNDINMLQRDVTVVFHMAASVRFDQPLKSAVKLITGGARNVLDLACTFHKLKVFMHVSTSYCHCDEQELEERLYEAPHNPRKILDLVSWMDDALLEHVTPTLLNNFPNTYAYTKCLTEQLVSEYASHLPLAIVRPSIVTATWREPISGWVDNLNGPTGLIVGAAKGVIRTMHCNPQYDADVVPVDVTINAMLAIAYKVGSTAKINGNSINNVDVYNITKAPINSITWGEALDIGRRHFYNNPFSVCLWYPKGDITANFWVHWLCAFLFHTIPAYFVDFLLVLTHHKPFLVRTQKRIHSGLKVLQYYTTRPWRFRGEKFATLWSELSNNDRVLFYSIQDKIDMDSYLLSYVLGARKYCVHEEPETLPTARRLLKRLFFLDVIKNIILGALMLWLLHGFAKTFLGNLPYPPTRSWNATLGHVPC